MNDLDIAYALEDTTIKGPWRMQLFDRENTCLGYQSPEYIEKYHIAVRKKERTLWWTSDEHFGHANIIKYCARPFATVPEMDAEMIRRWNAVVRPDETVMVIGDFSFHGEEVTTQILARLHGEKILVKGNHDRCKTDTYWKRVGFREVVQHWHVMLEQIGRVFIKHEPEPYGSSWPVQFNGHVHEKWKTKYYKTTGQVYINVGVDQWAFAPVSTQELVGMVKAERERQTGDGGMHLNGST